MISINPLVTSKISDTDFIFFSLTIRIFLINLTIIHSDKDQTNVIDHTHKFHTVQIQT